MRCHGQDLMGGEMAPALSDGQFRSNWDGVPVGELFERIAFDAGRQSGWAEPAAICRYSGDMFFRGGFPAVLPSCRRGPKCCR